ncbi:programmed cell death 1 ligand 1-like [Elgaria multicarinata webbii]|uniref:programmed cell death 1 ligand 1-like n=1 Tax=Elgaria multicarinata webbii TaxID=159646 RepID=UPI002FCCE00C
MFRFLPVLLLEIQIHSITASLIVEVLQPRYRAELGDDVIMGCRFRASEPLNLTRLSVLWQARLSREDAAKEVYKLTKGQEDLTQQHRDFRGRATVLQAELKMGCSMLRLTNVKLRDAGTYICLVDYKGDDYKYINLEVEARYKKINIQETREEEDMILTCQSEGYPQADISWYSENDANFSTFASTTYEMTDDGRYNITSVLRVKPSIYENYTCIFWNKELNEKTSAHRAVFLSGKRRRKAQLPKRHSDL